MSCHRIRKLPPNITVMFRTNIQQRFGPIWALCYCSDLCFGQPTLLLPLCCSRLSPRQHTCTILLSSKPRAPPGGRYLQVQARCIFSSSECSQYERFLVPVSIWYMENQGLWDYITFLDILNCRHHSEVIWRTSWNKPEDFGNECNSYSLWQC